MKKSFSCLLAVALLASAGTVFAQSVAINEDGAAPNANAILDIKSFTKGILIPRVSTGGRLSIANTKGLLLYDTTTSSFWYNTGTAWQHLLAAGSAAADSTAWLLGGNGGTSNTHFIGTTDTRPLLVRVNSQPSGRIDPTQGNSAWGYSAGFLMTDSIASDSANSSRGINNTAIGAFSLFSNFRGERNTATGYQSLRSNTSGVENTAQGFNVLSKNTFGARNTAVGAHALELATSATDNTAVGASVLASATLGGSNVGIGSRALFQNTTGSSNTASGSSALTKNTTGSTNTAHGNSSLSANTTGGANTGIGNFSLNGHTTGDGNTAVGNNSLAGDRTGTSNTAIGNQADVASGNLSNATAIGAGATVNASNKVRIGNSAVTVIEGQVPFTTPSDGRYKYHVQEDVKGLDFILQLRPVTYQFDVKRFDNQQNGHTPAIPASHTIQAAYNEAAAIRRSGFIAQEVEKAADATRYDFSGIIKPKTEQEHYSLSYESFVVPLVKGMQEQQQLIDAQNKKIAQQEKELASFRQQLDELSRLVRPQQRATK